MIGTLTKHFFQNGVLTIPHIGLFQLEYHPAVLHFADRLLNPPYTTIVFVPDSGSTSLEQEFSGGDLELFGAELKRELGFRSFHWQGIGTLQLTDGNILFEAEKGTSLQPVTANKVLRENRQHAILVGDREESSADTSFIEESNASSKNWMWIGWLILLLILLAIGWHLYKNGSLGSQSKVHTSAATVPIVPVIQG